MGNGVGDGDSCAVDGRISRRSTSIVERRRSGHVLLFVCPVRKIPNICCQRLQVDNRVSVIFPDYAERQTFCGILSIGRRRAHHGCTLPVVHVDALNGADSPAIVKFACNLFTNERSEGIARVHAVQPGGVSMGGTALECRRYAGSVLLAGRKYRWGAGRGVIGCSALACGNVF